MLENGQRARLNQRVRELFMPVVLMPVVPIVS
jgi:hypothetical protein